MDRAHGTQGQLKRGFRVRGSGAGADRFARVQDRGPQFETGGRSGLWTVKARVLKKLEGRGLTGVDRVGGKAGCRTTAACMAELGRTAAALLQQCAGQHSSFTTQVLSHGQAMARGT